jgi:hypothetical protein
VQPVSPAFWSELSLPTALFPLPVSFNGVDFSNNLHDMPEAHFTKANVWYRLLATAIKDFLASNGASGLQVVSGGLYDGISMN